MSNQDDPDTGPKDPYDPYFSDPYSTGEESGDATTAFTSPYPGQGQPPWPGDGAAPSGPYGNPSHDGAAFDSASYADHGAGDPTGTPPSQAPAVSEPYGQPHVQAPWPAPYQPPPGYSPYPPSRPMNTSALILVIISAMMVLTCYCAPAAIVPLILGILGLTKNESEPSSAASYAKWGWVILAVLTVLSVVAVASLIAWSMTTPY